MVLSVLCAWLVEGADRPAVSTKQPRVLVLFSNERLLPANVIADEAIRATFAASANPSVEFYSESLDVDRFPGEAQQEHTRDFLREKYRERPPDLVIAAGGASLAFLVKYRDSVFSGIPVVHCAVSPAELDKLRPDDRIAGIPFVTNAAETLELALRLQPDTRQVAIIDGGNNAGLHAGSDLGTQFSAFEDRVTFRRLTNKSLADLRRELSELPDHTVVLYRSMFRDAGGNTFTPLAALRQIAPASRVPIYGYYDTFLGNGIVGGSMVTFESIGQGAARVALRILAGEEAPAAARAEIQAATPMFDWRQLQRWNISAERLPPGSVVRFRPLTLWEEHKNYVLGGLAIFAAQALTITLLLVQAGRRKQAQQALGETEKRAALAADAANLGSWIWDIPNNHLWTGERCKALFGFPADADLNNEDFRARVHPEDRAMRDQAMESALAGTGKYDPEYRVLLPDGTIRWLAAAARVEHDASGKPTRMLGVSMDITERHQAEETAHELGGRLINAQEVERTRIARDLHDDLSQRLALISVELEMFGQEPPAQAEVVSGRMREFSEAVKGLSSDVHRLAHELHPAKLDQLGLTAAVRGFCKELAAAHEIAIVFEARDVPRALQDGVALCLYRVTQEALQNVIKHSGATSAKVELAAGEGQLQLRIYDDGSGFDPSTPPTKASLGLLGMRERVRMVGGLLTVQSQPGEGTRVEVVVPLGG